jgi:hypothetical protein
LVNRTGALGTNTTLGRLLRSYVPSKPRLDGIRVDRVQSWVGASVGRWLRKRKKLEAVDLRDGDKSIGACWSDEGGRGDGGIGGRASGEDEKIGQRISCIDSAFGRSLVRRSRRDADAGEQSATG